MAGARPAPTAPGRDVPSRLRRRLTVGGPGSLPGKGVSAGPAPLHSPRLPGTDTPGDLCPGNLSGALSEPRRPSRAAEAGKPHLDHQPRRETGAWPPLFVLRRLATFRGKEQLPAGLPSRLAGVGGLPRLWAWTRKVVSPPTQTWSAARNARSRPARVRVAYPRPRTALPARRGPGLLHPRRPSARPRWAAAVPETLQFVSPLGEEGKRMDYSLVFIIKRTRRLLI